MSSVTWWSAVDSEGKSILIEDAKRGLEYSCPDCEAPMVPKKGEIISWHFAHKGVTDGHNSGCSGEGPAHHRVKTFLAEMLETLLPWCIVKTEVYVDKWRPDISVFGTSPSMLYEVGTLNEYHGGAASFVIDKMREDRWEGEPLTEEPMFIVEVIASSETNPDKKEYFDGRIYEIHIDGDESPEWLSNPMNLMKRYGRHLFRIQHIASKHLKGYQAEVDKASAKLLKALSKKVERLYTDYRPKLLFGSFAKIGNDKWGAFFKDNYPEPGEHAILISKSGSFAQEVILGDVISETDYGSKMKIRTTIAKHFLRDRDR